jgi:hypothetical protein
MTRTVKAIVDENGQVSLLEPVRPSTARRALVTMEMCRGARGCRRA